MRHLMISLVTASLFSMSASADFLGIYIGAGNWSPEASGSFSNGADSITIGNPSSGEDYVDYKDKSKGGFYVAFEHPIPIIPNIMIRSQALTSNGSGTFSGEFGGETFDEDVISEYKLDHQDYTIYYEILDNWANLDLGFTFRKFDGYINISSTTTAKTEEEKFDATIPMLYGKARFDLPFTGLSLNADVNYLSYSDYAVSDISAYLGYETSIGVGIQGGIRTFSIEAEDDDDINLDLEFEGVFVHATFHF